MEDNRMNQIVTPTPAPYQYGPLPAEDHIRLLELHPGPWDCPIEFQMCTAKINTAQAYESISYTWGEPQKIVKVICNDQCLWITRNLAEALRQVRLPHHSRFLWADAVCINQDDTHERESQVRMMAYIYERAGCVLVSLGSDNGDAEYGFGVLRSLSKLCEMQIEEHGGSMENVPVVELNDTGRYAALNWAACRSILARPWFLRAWIVQEVGLAKQVHVLCGRFSMDWHTLVQACFWITWKGRSLEEEHRLPVKHPVNTWVTYATPEAQAGHILRDSARKSAPRSFFDVLFRTRFHDATDPRDKIFAFLGHATAKSLLEGGGHSIQVNYSMPFEELYTNVALRLLEQMQNLRLLCFVQHERQFLGFGPPSWVPRFHRTFEGWIMGSSRWPYYAAGIGAALQWMYVEDEKALDIWGLEFDTVVSHSDTLLESDFLLPGCDIEVAQQNSRSTHPIRKLDAYVSQADVLTSCPAITVSLILSLTLTFGVIGRNPQKTTRNDI